MSDGESSIDRDSEDEEEDRNQAVTFHSKMNELGLVNFPFLKNKQTIIRVVEKDEMELPVTKESWPQGEKNFWGHTNVSDKPAPGPFVKKYRPGDIVDPAKFSNKETLRMYDDNGGACAVGAGDHHTYRKIRRRVLARQFRMEREHDEKVAKEQREAKMQQEKDELAAITAKKSEKRKRKKELQQAAKQKQKLEKLLPVKNDGSFFEMVQAQLAKLEQEKAANAPSSEPAAVVLEASVVASSVAASSEPSEAGAPPESSTANISSVTDSAPSS